jgi:3D (Asp-Asp-Asp) domain-containing protein
MNKILVILTISFICAQHQSLFQPNSEYLSYGKYRLDLYQSIQNPQTTLNEQKTESDTGVRGWHLIPFRTVAVPPQQVLVGSVLFIPQLVGIKLPNGIPHDGYVLAHDIIPDINTNEIRIYSGDEFQWENITGSTCDVYRITGVMASTIRHQYRMQYRDKQKKQTFEMSWKELQNLMQTVRKDFTDLNKRIQYISSRGLGTPYVVFNLGEGGTAPYDPDPLVNFSQTDCMTFCEHTLAMAISTTYQEMFKNLQKIRYKDGVIDIRTRNHYSMADWLPNNNWFLKDVTGEVGGSLCKQMTKTINRKKDFIYLGIPEEELKAVAPPQKLTIDYIPNESLIRITDNLKGGEIVSIISNRAGIFSAHMGIIVRDEWDNVIFRHGSSRETIREVIDVPFKEMVDQLRQSKTRVGMAFMRVREQN